MLCGFRKACQEERAWSLKSRRSRAGRVRVERAAPREQTWSRRIMQGTTQPSLWDPAGDGHVSTRAGTAGALRSAEPTKIDLDDPHTPYARARYCLRLTELRRRRGFSVELHARSRRSPCSFTLLVPRLHMGPRDRGGRDHAPALPLLDDNSGGRVKGTIGDGETSSAPCRRPSSAVEVDETDHLHHCTASARPAPPRTSVRVFSSHGRGGTPTGPASDTN